MIHFSEREPRGPREGKHRMDRNNLKGYDGDRINATLIPAAATSACCAGWQSFRVASSRCPSAHRLVTPAGGKKRVCTQLASPPVTTRALRRTRSSAPTQPPLAFVSPLQRVQAQVGATSDLIERAPFTVPVDALDYNRLAVFRGMT